MTLARIGSGPDYRAILGEREYRKLLRRKRMNELAWANWRDKRRRGWSPEHMRLSCKRGSWDYAKEVVEFER